MKEALVVSSARTPIGKAYRGLFNNTEAPTMGGLAIQAAVARAGLEAAEVEDVVMGCALPQGTSSPNIGRLCKYISHPARPSGAPERIRRESGASFFDRIRGNIWYCPVQSIVRIFIGPVSHSSHYPDRRLQC